MPEVGAPVTAGTVIMTVDDNGAAQFFPGTAALAIGSPSDAPWDGVAADATVISLLKKIALNTAPA